MGTHDGSAAQERKHKSPLSRFRAAHELASCGDRNLRRSLATAERRPNENTNRAGGDRRKNCNGTARTPGTPKQRQVRAGTVGQTRTDRRLLPGGDRPADRPADCSQVATDPPTDPERKHEKGWGTADGEAERYRQDTRHADALIGRAGAGGQALSVPPPPTAPTTTTRGGPGAWRRCASATDPARRNPTTYLT